MAIEITNFSIIVSDEYISSLKFLIGVKQVNLFFTLICIILGLLGHLMTIFVFGQRRFRRNSSNVYLLCLAFTDAAYLLVHFFEDTLKTSRDVNFNSNDIISMINIVEKFDVACRIFNYLRYTLRFISSYIIVAFTLQRLFLIFAPLSHKFKTKRSAWISVFSIVLFGFLIHLWVPFLFEKNEDDSFEYCDVSAHWTKNKNYYYITLAYTFMIMLIPIAITLISNLLMIYYLLIRNRFKKNGNLSSNHEVFNMKISSNQLSPKMKPYYMSIDQIIRRNTSKGNNSKKITLMLIIISISFTFLNMPYLISWSIYYKELLTSSTDTSPTLNYLYSYLKISEIFSLLIYSVNFYLYCASGSLFRSQLKFSSKFLFNFFSLIVIFYFFFSLFKII